MTIVMKKEESRHGPRERMVRSAGTLIRSNGVHGTGMREIVEQADAPRGSLQHYFPGGKDQLITEGVLLKGDMAARKVGRFLGRLDYPSPLGLFTAIVDDWRGILHREGYAGGCPLLAAGIDPSLAARDAARQAFDGWLDPLAQALVVTGVPEDRATPLAILLVSALEGAIVLSRVRRDTGPLDTIVAELAPLLDTGGPR